MDRTGLAGEYELTLEMNAEVAVFTAVREQLWTLLGESFWNERNVARLVPMVEHVIAALDAAVNDHEA